jgi:hypothetical protein
VLLSKEIPIETWGEGLRGHNGREMNKKFYLSRLTKVIDIKKPPTTNKSAESSETFPS